MNFLYSHRTRAADGQHVHIRALTEALLARGHLITMAGPEDGSPSARKLDAGGPARSGGGLSLLPGPAYEAAEFAYSWRGLQRLMERAQATDTSPDVIYERYNLYYHAGIWARRKLGLPLLLEVNAPLAEERARHGNLSLKGLANRSERAIWRGADMCLPVTDALADYLRRAGVPDERICVIPNGVDDDFLRDQDGSSVRQQYGLEGRTVLGFTGFVRDWHGVDRVLRYMAAAQARTVTGADQGRDLVLLLVGDGPARADLEREARALGLADRLVVTGVVQREAMARHVASFDIALQPAVTAYASPLKLYEYMAQARAIVAPASPNIREALRDGENALLFAPDDDAGLYACLDRLVDDGALRARLGAAARQRLIAADYTWAGNARRVEALAERAIGR